MAQHVPARRAHPLSVFFRPKSVAVVGASETEGSVGRAILWNLLSSPFGGPVFPVNPKRRSVLGIKAYPKIADVPEKVDLAVVAIPAAAVPAAIGECAASGIGGAIVISAGFKERGPAGAELESQVMAQARRGNMRIIGPNCLGVMSPLTGLNATFAAGMARSGSVGFISQSGALCTAVLDWSLQNMVGFSAFVSTGSMVDVSWGDLIDYLGDDPHTQSIVIYMESVGNARSFLSAAREVALAKPIIVIKVGRSAAAAKAAASHTGALTGSDDVLDAAFRRAGVLRVERIADLFYMADVLAKQPRPKGPRLAIVTNAGGPGVLATDALLASNGQLAPLSDSLQQSLSAFLPEHWSHNNPIDILGDADAERYGNAVKTVAADPENDGLLAILSPQGMTDAAQTAEALKPFARLDHKPVLASWMGGAEVAAGAAILNRAGIPVFPFPDTAARLFSYMWQYTYNLRAIYETPALTADPTLRKASADSAGRILDEAAKSARTLLTEAESKRLLKAYGIPVVETREARSEDEAVAAASEMGFPVAVKVLSETITHKTDVGGVQLNLRNADGVGRAYRAIRESVSLKVGAGHFQGVTVQPMIEGSGYELILGSSPDPQFGPVVLFGLGGQLVEVFQDRALALPPLNGTLARRMMERTRIFKALQGVRGRSAVDLQALEELLVRFSLLVAEQPRLKEIDINPLWVSPERILALDARVVLYPADQPFESLPRPAIRPYPSQYVSDWTMRNGLRVTLRPIRPEDEPSMIRFHQKLSERSVYYRYFGLLKLSQRIAHERLIRICFIDYDREMAVVAEHTDPKTGSQEIMGVGRLTKAHFGNEAEFALLVSDEFQHQGLGTELLRRVLQVACDEKLSRVVGDVLSDNLEMKRLCEKAGMQLQRIDGSLLQASMKL